MAEGLERTLVSRKAAVVELVDTLDSGSSGSNTMRVRLPLAAPKLQTNVLNKEGTVKYSIGR